MLGHVGTGILVVTVILVLCTMLILEYFTRYHKFRTKYKRRFGRDVTIKGREDTFLKHVTFPEDVTAGWESICVPTEIVAQLQCKVIAPLKSIAGNSVRNTSLPKGILFSGKSGTGKSLLVRTLAKETNYTYIDIRRTEIFNTDIDTELDNMVKGLFSLAKKMEPAMIFVDEIDSIFSNDDILMETFLKVWDNIRKDGDGSGPKIIVVGTTNRQENVDPDFLRRFDLNILIPLPTLFDRSLILEIHLKGMKRDCELSTTELAKMTDGFSGSDLKEVARHAASLSLCEMLEKMIPQNNETLKKEEGKITQQNLGTPRKRRRALPAPLENNIADRIRTGAIDCAQVVGSAISKAMVGAHADQDEDYDVDNLFKSEISITMEQMIKSVEYSKETRSKIGAGVGSLLGVDENETAFAGNLIQSKDLEVTWENIAGLDGLVMKLEKDVIIPLVASVHRKIANSQFVPFREGILFHGPPGSGKTLLAKALAYHSRCAFINLDASALYASGITPGYAVHTCLQTLTSAVFRLAEKYQPSIIFIDEIDKLKCTYSGCMEFLLPTPAPFNCPFLFLWDAVRNDPNKNVFVMGASSHPKKIDPEIMQRLTKKYKIPLPNAQRREKILKQHLGNSVTPTVRYC